jgi:lauroyl/myristoyl acyltransferase
VSRLASAGYAAGWRVVRALPAPIARALFRAGADFATRRGGPAVRQLTDNLRTVTGLPDAELAGLVKAGMRSYARYWMEAFRLPSLSRDDIIASFVLENEDLLRAAHADGRGAIVALPHAGNWDHAGAYVSMTGMPLTTVAERLKPESLYRRFLAYRESLGMEILPTTGGGEPVIDVLARRLREGRLVVLLADRDLSARGVPVEFFGKPTRMPPGPALLALRTGAPLFAASLWYDGPLTKVRVDGPIEPPAGGDRTGQIAEFTQRIATQLEAGIARHPEDWHMLQRLWVAPKGAKTKPAAGPADAPAGSPAVPPAGSPADAPRKR